MKNLHKLVFENTWNCICFYLNHILMGLFGVAHGWGGGGGQEHSLPKICHTYTTMMKLGAVMPCLRISKKHINHVTHPLISTDTSIFSQETSNFFYLKKY